MRPAGRPESRRRSAPAAPAGHAVHRHVRLAAPAGADDDSAGPSRTGPPAVSPRGAPGRVPAAAEPLVLASQSVPLALQSVPLALQSVPLAFETNPVAIGPFQLPTQPLNLALKVVRDVRLIRHIDVMPDPGKKYK